MTRLSTTARGAANQWAEKWLATFELVGAVTLLGALVFQWLHRALLLRRVRFGFPAAVAQMDSDPYADLVHGQFWYKSDGLSPPSFSARMYCQTGPNGNMTFPAGLKVQTVDRKQHYASTERTRCIMHNFAGWSATLW